MTVIGIILGTLCGILAVVLLVVGVLGWTAKLPGNPIFGIRVPEVRKSKELWDMAHRVAGPLWALSGLAWAIAALVAFTASGWIWLVVGMGIIAGLVFLGMGAGMAAHTVAMVDNKRHREEIQVTRDAHPKPVDPEAGQDADSIAPAAKEEAPKPSVDFAALRRAIENSDQQ